MSFKPCVPTDSNPNAGMENAIQTSAIEDIEDIDENLSYCLADPSTDTGCTRTIRRNHCACTNITLQLCCTRAHKMPVSFHGPVPQQVARSFPSKRICQQLSLSFFRILEGRMTMHTVQGGRSDDTDFLVQVYVAFADISDTDTAAAHLSRSQLHQQDFL